MAHIKCDSMGEMSNYHCNWSLEWTYHEQINSQTINLWTSYDYNLLYNDINMPM